MNLLKRALIVMLCLMLLPSGFLAARAEEEEFLLGDIVYATLDEEDQAQWDEWETEELADGDDEAEAMAYLEALQDNAVTLDPTALELNENLPTHVVNILLLGIDARNDVTDIGLSDVVMICSIDTITGDIKLTSIARDTCVTLPGYKNQNRINTAYKFGGMAGEKAGIKDAGPALAMRTVNHNFDMNCEYFVTVNFFGLATIIDSLGGVDIELTKQEANRINYELKKEPVDKVKRTPVEGRAGIHHLDGMQAVTFARIRGIDNDLVRTSRQRKLIEVLLAQVIEDMTLDKMVHLMETSLQYVYTNMPMTKIYEVGRTVLSSDITTRSAQGESLLKQHRIPMDKCFTYKDIDGSSMIYLNDKNLKLNKESIHKFIYGDVYPR